VPILLVDFSRPAGELCMERGSWLTPVGLRSFETPSWALLLPAALGAGRWWEPRCLGVTAAARVPPARSPRPPPSDRSQQQALLWDSGG